MRVIAGQYRHRRLIAPAGLATRPSSDRLRETLFNILGPGVRGSVFVDAYAGSGAVGIEACSRGAAHVIWIEPQRAALAALRANLAALGIGGGLVLPMRMPAALAPLERDAALAARGGCDYLFLDPPYAEQAQTLRVLEQLGRRPRLLRTGAQVIVESRRDADWPEQCGELRRARVHPQGDSQLTFFISAGS